MRKVITIPEHTRILYFCDKCGCRISVERINKKLEICAACDTQTNFSQFVKNEATAKVQKGGINDKQRESGI